LGLGGIVVRLSPLRLPTELNRPGIVGGSNS
jgi:hypothetical protein